MRNIATILGQGEALDCYNMQLQDASVIAAKNENARIEQAMAIIDSITDPLDKAKMYKKIFGDCCDVPQSCGGCGCPEPTPPPVV